MVPGNNNPGEDEGRDLPNLGPDAEIDLDATAVPVDASTPSALPVQSSWFTPAETDLEQQARGRDGRRVPLRVRAALAGLAAVTIGVVALAHPGHESGPRASRVSATARPPAATTAATSNDPCTGLSGTVVTTQAGDTDTIAGVIASFEAAYFIDRDGAKAIGLVSPDAGMTEQGLNDGIGSIPKGSRHCVAVTPLSVNTANVHLVELHPDGRRVDYLQVVNTITLPGGAVRISHVQEQG